MQYLNENYVSAIEANPIYKNAIATMIKEVDDFYSEFKDDASLISRWGHNYFCDYDGGRLIFDIHKPHEHKCSVCGKIYKSDVYDGVWVYFYRNQAVLTAWKAAGIYAYNKDKKYLDIMKNIISFYAKNYKSFVLHNKEGLEFSSYDEMKWGCGKILPQGLNESIICIRMIQALEIVKGDLSKEYLDELYELMFSEMFKLFKPQINEIHNIRCWNNCALGLIGLFFGKDEIIDYVFNGPYNIRRQINEGVTEDGFWYEGSIHYNFFTLEGITPLIVFSEIYEYDFGKKEKDVIEKMFINAYHYAFENHTLPNPNDGWPNINLKTYSYIYHMASKAFGEYSEVGNILKNIEGDGSIRTTLPLSKPYYIDNELAYERLLLNTDYGYNSYTIVKNNTKNFPKSNFAMLRDSNFNVFVKYGLNGPSHSHPDIINVEIMYKNKMVSRDLSNCGYKAKLCNEWHRTSLAHNVVIKDGENIISTKPGKTLCYESNHIKALAENVYDGVDYIRDIKLLNDELFDKFEVISSSVATFDYVLHLESDFNLIIMDDVEEADLTYKRNGYQHILKTERVKATKDVVSLKARNDSFTLLFEIDVKDKELYILKTMDNPVNETRTTILLRKKSDNVTYNLKIKEVNE